MKFNKITIIIISLLFALLIFFIVNICKRRNDIENLQEQLNKVKLDEERFKLRQEKRKLSEGAKTAIYYSVPADLLIITNPNDEYYNNRKDAFVYIGELE